MFSLAGCGGGNSSAPPPLAAPAQYTIDQSILGGQGALSDSGLGTIPVAAAADSRGIVSRYVSDEVIMAGTQTDLDAFQIKYNGSVLASKEISDSNPKKSLYRIRIDVSNVPLQGLESNLSKTGLNGLTTFSSRSGAQIAALVLSEAASGTNSLALNFVSEGHLLRSTAEQADTNGVSDAFKWPEFNQRAWQFVQAHGFARRIKVAVIDGGFWLNNRGVPCDLDPAPSTTSCNSSLGAGPRAWGATDLPTNPVQSDTINSGEFAGGVNPNRCSGNSPCPWHGNATVSVILGALNNSAGAAGLGGQIADPILLKSDGTDSSVALGVLNALGAGADIINMSFGGDCNAMCRFGRSAIMDNIMDLALDNGVLVVASAGNSNVDALDHHVWPCQYSSGNGNGVYCVGALAWVDKNGTMEGGGYYASGTFRKASYSNFGTTVNIWAPTHIRAMPDGDSASALTIHNGTSAAAPYVSGVAAMCKAMNPNLDANGIKDVIGKTALIDNDPLGNPDPLVSSMIQPYAAVVACSGGYQLYPELTITAPNPGATLVADQYGIQFTATAADVDDGTWPLSGDYKPAGPTKITFVSDVDGALPNNSDTSALLNALSAPEGLRHVTASVTNSHGKTTSTTIAITMRYPHVKPAPVIVWPSAGSTVATGMQTVIGYAKSVDPGELGNLNCSQLIWNGNIVATPVPNDPSRCQAQLNFTAGQFQITLAATGRFGDVGVTTEIVNAVKPVQLTPVILSPAPGALAIIYNGSGTIGLQATAAPVQAGDALGFIWQWYYTDGSSGGNFISAGSGDGSAVSWNVANTGICSPNDNGVIRNVGVKVSVGEYPASYSGEASVNFQIMCSPLR